MASDHLSEGGRQCWSCRCFCRPTMDEPYGASKAQCDAVQAFPDEALQFALQGICFALADEGKCPLFGPSTALSAGAFPAGYKLPASRLALVEEG